MSSKQHGHDKQVSSYRSKSVNLPTSQSSLNLDSHYSQLPTPPLSLSAAMLQRVKLTPRALTPGEVLELQRAIGNQAVRRLLAAKGGSGSHTMAQSAASIRQGKLASHSPIGDTNKVIQRTAEDEFVSESHRFEFLQKREIDKKLVTVIEDYDPSTPLVPNLLTELKRYNLYAPITEKLQIMTAIMQRATALNEAGTKVKGLDELDLHIRANNQFLEKNAKMFQAVDHLTQEIVQIYKKEGQKYSEAAARIRMPMPLELPQKLDKAKNPAKVRGPLLRLLWEIEADTPPLTAAFQLLQNIKTAGFKYISHKANPGQVFLEGQFEGDCSTLSNGMCLILSRILSIKCEVRSIKEPLICLNKPTTGEDFDATRGLDIFDNHYWLEVDGHHFDPLFGGTPLNQSEYLTKGKSTPEQLNEFIEKHAKSDEEKEVAKEGIKERMKIIL